MNLNAFSDGYIAVCETLCIIFSQQGMTRLTESQHKNVHDGKHNDLTAQCIGGGLRIMI